MSETFDICEDHWIWALPLRPDSELTEAERAISDEIEMALRRDFMGCALQGSAQSAGAQQNG